MTIAGLAKIVTQMSYGELKQMAHEIAEIADSRGLLVGGRTGDAFPDLIFDWAESRAEGGADAEE